MKQHRTVGVFLIGSASICFLIAWERYHSAVQTAKEVARALDGIEFESVSTPVETFVAGLLGVAMTVAGVVLIMEYIGNDDKPNNLLKP
jgi:hypothetical protein